MALSLTCTCGARLEIDDKFAGQVIRCPDCHKELVLTPKTPQPLKTSGYALASVLLALIGAFTLIGPLLAMVCAWISLRHQARYPDQVGGKKYAHAGLILGGLFTLVSLAAFLSPEVLGVDGLFREIEWASKLDYPSELHFLKENKFSITRPNSSWGFYRHLGKNASPDRYDDLILVKPRQDAQVACLTIDLHDPEEPDDQLEHGLREFLSSELVDLIGNFRGKTPNLSPKIRDKKKLDSPKGTLIQEMLIDLNLGGYPRTFILRIIKVDGLFKLIVVAAGTRQQRFARLEPELRKIVESYKVEK
jgi:hypothetical protein